jgi:hypothetical protein
VAAAAAAAAAALPDGEGGEIAGASDTGSGRVWRIALSSGRVLALKLASAQAPLGGELQALRWLAQRAAPVPAVLAADAAPQPGWLALEWCGDSTLDDALQGAAAPGAAAPGGAVGGAAAPGAAVGDDRWGEGGKGLVRAVAALEGAFWPISAGARRRPVWDQQVAALRAQAAPWLAAAPQALGWLLQEHSGHTGGGPERSGGGEGGVAVALRRTAELALHGEPDVGSLDYNARNVVLDEARGRVTLVDFAATGVDWPERRLVQYATATGGAQGGTFRSALTAEAVRDYAARVAPRRGVDPEVVVAAVDAHEVLLLLLAAVGLQAVEAGTAHPERARAWGDVRGRREALLTLLRRPLGGGGPGAELRAAVRAAGAPSPAAPAAPVAGGSG